MFRDGAQGCAVGDRRAGVYIQHTPTPDESAPSADHDARFATNLAARSPCPTPTRARPASTGRCVPGQVNGGHCATADLPDMPQDVIHAHSRRRALVNSRDTHYRWLSHSTCPGCCHRSDSHHHRQPTIATTRAVPFLPLSAHRMGSHAQDAATHWPRRSQGARPEPQPGGQPSTSTGHHGGTGCSGRRAVRPPAQGSHRAQRRTPGHDAG